MKIENKTPISLAEVAELLGNPKEEEPKKIQQLRNYLHKFVKLNAEEARKLKQELVGLGMIKLKEQHIVKIIDILPQDAEDVRKIFVGSDVSLSQEEIEKILGVVAKYVQNEKK